ncbi:MAG: hypothetical protein SCH71_13645 [Desulfobulbaceae bacterium]|nr:hypothetical protein [Desulfobulbaceae bacterium]
MTPRPNQLHVASGDIVVGRMQKITGMLNAWPATALLLGILLCLMSLPACSPTTAIVAPEVTGGEAEPDGRSGLNTDPALKEKWGIEITSLNISAAGHMVDFRFRVLDPEKAAGLFKREDKPYLIDQATQQVMSVPRSAKVGPLRTSDPPQQDRIYWMFFGTVPGLVKSGSEVTVVIGDFRVENLVVQ